MYKIHPHTKARAKALGVHVEPSKRKGKKIDIFSLKDGSYITSVGAIGYKDYPTYLLLEKQGKVPPGTAESKRKAYKRRHVFRKIRRTKAWWAYNLLW